LKIIQRHSHLNGWEYLVVHKRRIWQEIESAIAAVDAFRCKTKTSEEERKKGQLLYSPIMLNAAFNKVFAKRRTVNWLCQDVELVKQINRLPPEVQKARIEAAGLEPLETYNQTDFVKDRVAVEVQFGKYSFVAHDLFVKHTSFFVNDDIDVGVEIVPMKAMEREMSSGVAYFERDLFNMLRQGRGSPLVPIILIGVVP
jgi:hypothetical protein